MDGAHVVRLALIVVQFADHHPGHDHGAILLGFREPLENYLTHSPGGVVEKGKFLGLVGVRPEELEASFKSLMGGPISKCQALTTSLQAFIHLHRLFPTITPSLPFLLSLVNYLRPYKIRSPPPSPSSQQGEKVNGGGGGDALDPYNSSLIYLACQVVHALSLEGRYSLHWQLSSQEADLLQSPSTLGDALQRKDLHMVGEVSLALVALDLEGGTPKWEEAQSFLRGTQMDDGGWPPAASSSSSSLSSSCPSPAGVSESMSRLLSTVAALRGLCPIRAKGYGPFTNVMMDSVRRLNARYETISSDGKVALKPPPATAIWCGGGAPSVAPLSAFEWLKQHYASTATAHLDPLPPPLSTAEKEGTLTSNGLAGGRGGNSMPPVTFMTVEGLGLNEILDTSLRGRLTRRLNDLLRWRRRKRKREEGEGEGEQK